MNGSVIKVWEEYLRYYDVCHGTWLMSLIVLGLVEQVLLVREGESSQLMGHM